MENTIVRYIRVRSAANDFIKKDSPDGDPVSVRAQRPVGCLVAEKSDGSVSIGWSYCHRRDQFSKDIGRGLALLRLRRHPLPPPLNKAKMPHRVRREMEHFCARASRYFRVPVDSIDIVDMPVEHERTEA